MRSQLSIETSCPLCGRWMTRRRGDPRVCNVCIDRAARFWRQVFTTLPGIVIWSAGLAIGVAALWAFITFWMIYG